MFSLHVCSYWQLSQCVELVYRNVSTSVRTSWGCYLDKYEIMSKTKAENIWMDAVNYLHICYLPKNNSIVFMCWYLKATLFELQYYIILRPTTGNWEWIVHMKYRPSIPFSRDIMWIWFADSRITYESWTDDIHSFPRAVVIDEVIFPSEKVRWF